MIDKRFAACCDYFDPNWYMVSRAIRIKGKGVAYVGCCDMPFDCGYRWHLHVYDRTSAHGLESHIYNTYGEVEAHMKSKGYL